ncbi:MAG TPA: patatin-like phospholipase family protein, partial [Chthonomonadales bacterium]|nr:patatin-like phospholipase family protein [Chthonomonadales bacterium]
NGGLTMTGDTDVLNQQVDAAALWPQSGIGLCLSGGGYRAMLFHLGALHRMNELGLLPLISRYSSVSGGSITSALLGLKWRRLIWQNSVASNFEEEVVRPLRALAAANLFDHSTTLRSLESLATEVFSPGHIANEYNALLFQRATLQDLPGSEADDFTPRFVFNATNLMTGSLWRFSKPYMADWKVGMWSNPTLSLAEAVAASSAFPIALAPVQVPLDPVSMQPLAGASLAFPPYTERACLVDGGVYDNMGIETVWKESGVVLVSDASGRNAPVPHPLLGGRDPLAVFGVFDSQVADLRKRDLIRSYTLPASDQDYRGGAYWGVGSDITHYPAPSSLPCPPDRTRQLAAVATVLSALQPALQEQLINWGYAICDAALNSFCSTVPGGFGARIVPATSFPYPGGV